MKRNLLIQKFANHSCHCCRHLAYIYLLKFRCLWIKIVKKLVQSWRLWQFCSLDCRLQNSAVDVSKTWGTHVRSKKIHYMILNFYELTSFHIYAKAFSKPPNLISLRFQPEKGFVWMFTFKTCVINSFRCVCGVNWFFLLIESGISSEKGKREKNSCNNGWATNCDYKSASFG